MSRAICAVLLIAGLSVLVGCASEGRRVDANTEAVMTHDFNPKDLQLVSRQAVAELMGKARFPVDQRPAVYVSQVRNLTNEHINCEAIREYVLGEVGDSGKVRLLERNAAREEAMREMELQQGVMVDPATARRVGKQVGAAYFFQGTLMNIESQAGRKKGQYFLFTLKLVDVETLDVTTSRVEIQKLSKKGLFGW